MTLEEEHCAMAGNELREQVLRLDSKTRAVLARELLLSLDEMDESEVDDLWLDEAVRRDEELDDGLATARPADEVIQQARSRRV